MTEKKVISLPVALLALLTAIFTGCTHLHPDEITINPEDIITPKEISFEQKEFIASTLPHIWDVNELVSEDRRELNRIIKKYNKRNRLRRRQLKKFNTLLEHYDLKSMNYNNSGDTSLITAKVDSLLPRVNTVPVRLVLAQAIIESGWGTSRFAREGNNLFGIRCYTPGCGLQPDGVDNNNFWVRSYRTQRESVHDYIMLLNTGYAFKKFRSKRQGIWEDGKKPTALQLSTTLSRYSEKRSAYIDLLSAVIMEYTPKNIDELYARAM